MAKLTEEQTKARNANKTKNLIVQANHCRASSSINSIGCKAVLAWASPPVFSGDQPSTWAREATAWAKENEIINGDGEGNYGWQQPITREALATVLYNFQNYLGK